MIIESINWNENCARDRSKKREVNLFMLRADIFQLYLMNYKNLVEQKEEVHKFE